MRKTMPYLIRDVIVVKNEDAYILIFLQTGVLMTFKGENFELLNAIKLTLSDFDTKPAPKLPMC
jgi:hypothetical protein